MPAEAWMLAGVETARRLCLATACVVTYNTGGPDTLPALTNAAVDGGGTTFDCTTDSWVAYIVQGTPTLKLAKESALPTSGTYALLARVSGTQVLPYQAT